MVADDALRRSHRPFRCVVAFAPRSVTFAVCAGASASVLTDVALL